MYAIVESGGKQYRVGEGETLEVEKLSADEGEEVVFDKILAVDDGNGLQVGQPYVEGCQVKGKVLKQGRSRKLTVFKYKPKKRYRRKMGHRQPYTQVRIEKIACDG